jgi:predicted RNA-binding Zn ribbon-like protein
MSPSACDDCLRRTDLVAALAGRLDIEWRRRDAPGRVLALDAAELLEHEVSRGLVGVCEERLVGRCAWLFLDSTRNHSRRFCSMKECGNRAKQRRHYQRAKRSP